MSHGRDWRKAHPNPRGYEQATPNEKPEPLRGGSHVKPGKVKRWAQMTQAEREAVLASLKK